MSSKFSDWDLDFENGISDIWMIYADVIIYNICTYMIYIVRYVSTIKNLNIQVIYFLIYF